MNHRLRPWIWPAFLASSVLETCDVLIKYASDSAVARLQGHLHGLATAIHETSGLEQLIFSLMWANPQFEGSVESLTRFYPLVSV